MNTVLIIPARFDSERFPGKPYAIYKGKPLIQHIYDKAKALPVKVVICIDTEREAGKVQKLCGGAEIFVSSEPTCAIERLYSYYQHEPNRFMYMTWPVDEPEIQVEEALRVLYLAGTQQFPTSCYCRFWDREVLESNLSCKVTTSKDWFVYSSRSIIPGRKYLDRERHPEEYKKHVGLFFFPGSWLSMHGGYFFSEQGETEDLESLEQNRFADLQQPLRMVQIEHLGFGIDKFWQLSALETLTSKEN